MPPGSLILIVEDEEPLSKALDLKLTAAGFNTLVTRDGEDAMQILAREKINLLVLDLILPKKDGFWVLSEMRRLRIKMPVFVVSNLSQTEDIAKAKDFGIEDYIVKSNETISGIIERIQRYAGRKPN